MDNNMTDTESKLTLKIEQDLDPMSPREWDNLGTLALFHRRYDLGDQGHGLRSGDFDGWDDMEAHIEKELGAVAILPVYMYDHSGITIRTKPFSCPWDSGQIGFIFVTREKVLKDFNRKRMSKGLLSKVYECLESEVETYDRYITGDVWCYVIKGADGEVLDSCGGFFGEKEVQKQGEEMLAFYEKAEKAA